MWLTILSSVTKEEDWDFGIDVNEGDDNKKLPKKCKKFIK